MIRNSNLQFSPSINVTPKKISIFFSTCFNNFLFTCIICKYLPRHIFVLLSVSIANRAIIIIFWHSNSFIRFIFEPCTQTHTHTSALVLVKKKKKKNCRISYSLIIIIIVVDDVNRTCAFIHSFN